jgi:predicted ATP-grasp superfamily ATP-dependent carboligase
VTALITSSNSLKALTVIRSLGKKEVNVVSAEKKSGSLGSYSKYSRNNFTYPDPDFKEHDFVKKLLSELNKNSIDVLLPVHSEDTYVVTKYMDKFSEHTAVPFMDYKTINSVNDKSIFLKNAYDMGFAVPKTYHPDNFESLRKISREIDYPAVIKLRKSSSSIGLSYVNSPEEMLQKFKDTITKFNLNNKNYPIIQEYISGGGYGVSLLFNHGDLRAFFTHKRLREYPVSGGPSTCRISVRHPVMEKIAVDLLKSYNWHGIAMVEFKLTDEGKPVIMEVNPRFWGSVNQAVLSGVDFPYLLYRMAVDGDVNPVMSYKTGIKTRNAFIDIISIFQEIKNTKNPALIKEFLVCPFTDDVLSLADPMPTINFIKMGLRELYCGRYH